LRSFQVAIGLKPKNTLVQVVRVEGPLSPLPPPLSPPELPPRPGLFVNRVGELTTLEAAVRQEAAAERSRAVEITGPWGSGVSTAAIELGHRVRDLYPDAQVVMDLGQPGISEDDLAIDLLWRLQVPVERTEPESREALLRTALAGKRVLFILTNASDGNTPARLLPNVPGCGVIVTGRSELTGLDVGTHQRLGPMHPDATLEVLGRIVGTDRLAEASKDAAAINRSLGGHTLTARVVAEWIQQPGNRGRSLSSIRAELNGRRLLHLLKTDDRFAAAMDAARRSLSRPAWELVRSTALLPFTTYRVGLAARITGVPEQTVRGAVTELHRAGWLELDAEGDDRFRILPPVLQYARDRQLVPLMTVREHAVLREALGYYLERTRLDEGATQAEAEALLRVVRQDRTQIVATIVHGFRAGLHQLVWQLSVRCGRLFRALGFKRAWERTARIGVAAAQRTNLDEQPLAVALTSENLGDALMDQDRIEDAVHWYQVGRNSRQLLDDRPGGAQLLFKLGVAHQQLRHNREAMEALRRSLELSGEGARPEAMVPLLQRLVEVAEKAEGADAALAYAQWGRRQCEEVGDRHGALWFLLRLGALQQEMGSPKESLDTARTAEAEARTLGDQASEGAAAELVGNLHRGLGQPVEAAAALRRAAEAFAAHNELPRAVAASRQSAELYRGAGLQPKAQDSLRLGDQLLDRIDQQDLAEARRDLIELQHQLGEVGWVTGDLQGAERAFAKERELAEEDDDRIRARALDGLGRVWARQAERLGLDPEIVSRLRDKSVAASAEAAELFDRRHSLQRARALHRCGSLLLKLGRPGQAAEVLEESCDAYRLGGSPLEHARALEELAGAFAQAGGANQERRVAEAFLECGMIRSKHEPEAAAGPLARAAHKLKQLGVVEEAAPAYLQLAAVQTRLGRHHQAAEAHQARAALCAATGDLSSRGRALAAVGGSLERADRREDAAVAYLQAAEAFAQHQPLETDTSLRKAVELAERSSTRIDARTELARTYISAERQSDAIRLLDETLKENGIDTDRKVRVLRLLATAGDEPPRLKVAENALWQLAEIFAASNRPLDEAATRDHLAEVLHSRSRSGEAVDQFVKSAELHVALASHDASSDHWLQAADRYQRAGNICRKSLDRKSAVEYLTQAKEYLETAHALDAHPRVLYDLAQVCVDDGGVASAEVAADCLAQYRETLDPTSRHTAEFREVVELEMLANKLADRPKVADSLQALLDPPAPPAAGPAVQGPAASQRPIADWLRRHVPAEDLPGITKPITGPIPDPISDLRSSWTQSMTQPPSPASPIDPDDQDPWGRTVGGMSPF
jgi:tetratricopeptide (TPR) repeat protein